MITIVDYGMGNLGAIVNMLEFLGYDAVTTADPLEISKASKLILPGVGAFDRAMLNLRRLGFVATTLLLRAQLLYAMRR